MASREASAELLRSLLEQLAAAHGQSPVARALLASSEEIREQLQTRERLVELLHQPQSASGISAEERQSAQVQIKALDRFVLQKTREALAAVEDTLEESIALQPRDG